MNLCRQGRHQFGFRVRVEMYRTQQLEHSHKELRMCISCGRHKKKRIDLEWQWQVGLIIILLLCSQFPIKVSYDNALLLYEELSISLLPNSTTYLMEKKESNSKLIYFNFRQLQLQGTQLEIHRHDTFIYLV